VGDGLDAVLENLRAGRSPGLQSTERWTPGQALTVGAVDLDLPSLDAFGLEHRSRNNQLALHNVRQIEAELRQAVADFGPARVAVIVGTTTSGMAEAEAAFQALHARGAFPENFVYAQQELGSPAEFLAEAWGLQGPAFTVSTACSSSAKALAVGRRLLRLGACDAVLAGGVDTLCRFTLRGFMALGALSPEPSLPFKAERKGINIGEAAAFFVLRKDRGPVQLLGVGETSDAYNISAPLPEGEGARDAMQAALQDAGLQAGEIDYVNLHGTGTLQNDAMEAKALHAVFPQGVACSSTKALTGHTLGAAGALEAGFCWALLSGATADAWAPHQSGTGSVDPSLPALKLLQKGDSLARKPRKVLSNVFGFGGTNVSLVLGAA
jgi:3-oxoacyl-[acyl-carrier-protein] synthase-1